MRTSTSATERESVTVDALDRRLIHALLHDGRASFRRIGEVVDAPERTVARRYRRLREAGVLRVVGVREVLRCPEYLVLRIQTHAGGAVAVAKAMAGRPDISWVTISAGASEVVCALATASPRTRDALLVQGLPRASQVAGVATAAIMHVFADGPETEWRCLPDALDAERLRRLGPGTSRRSGHAGITAGADAQGYELDDADLALLEALARDGRASWAALAAETGRSEAQVTRRFQALLASGRIYVDVELAPALLGFGTWAELWIATAPSDIQRVGRAVAAHPETAFVAATTGRTSIMALVWCRDHAHLFAYVTERVGAVEGVRDLEIVPAMSVVKQHGSVMDGDRLPDPLAGP